MIMSDLPGPFTSLAQIKAAVKARGGHFFDKRDMDYWSSRVEPGVYAGRYFVTSEQPPELLGVIAPRGWTIQRVEDDGRLDTIGSFQAFPRADLAIAAVTRLVERIASGIREDDAEMQMMREEHERRAREGGLDETFTERFEQLQRTRARERQERLQ
jgi:hypothetical protein